MSNECRSSNVKLSSKKPQITTNKHTNNKADRFPIYCLLSAVYCLLFLCTCGCGLLGSGMVRSRVPTYGKKIAVIPFRGQDYYYVESTVGMEMAELISQFLLRYATDMKVVDPSPAYNLIQDKDPARIDWGAVAKRLGVDYVLTGNILQFQSRDPKLDIACYRGTMQIHVTVYQPDESRVSRVLIEFVNANYPTGSFSASHISVLETTDEKVKARLKLKAAARIARFFYAHEPEQE